MNHKKLSWLPWAVSIIIFISLLAALLYSRDLLPANRMLPTIFGLSAFSLVLTEVLLSLRPKFLERQIGLSAIYKIHGMTAFVLVAASIIHAAMIEATKGGETALTIASFTGSLSMLLLIVILLTGMFILSGSYIRKFPFLKRLKIHTIKREAGLWIHRLARIAVPVIFVHMVLIDYVRSNTSLCILLGVYVTMTMVAVAVSYVSRKRLPRYKLHNCKQLNEKVFELEFRQENSDIMTYNPGQFVFIRFLISQVSNESHPFSISSALAHDNNSIKVMIKKSGDYTSTMNLLKKDDVAILEGPYGNFMDKRVYIANNPLVMLAGGIGITPMLSILRSQRIRQPTRRIVLVWALTQKNELMLVDELQSIQKINPNFSYQITFDQEHVETFNYGRISNEYLHRIRVSTLYNKADFYICGPPPMMNAVKSILLDNHVEPESIHTEDFSF